MDINGAHAGVVGLSLIVGAAARPYLEQSARALPHWLATRARDRFEAEVAAGKISPPVARLARALKRAVLTWADAEMPQALGHEKMALALLSIEKLPYIGPLVAADPQGVEDELQAEYDAVRREVALEAAGQPPAAQPNPAAANPAT